LSNQPPGAANAPLTAPPTATAQAATTGVAPAATNSHRESTVNYEVDKTVRHVRNELGSIKRLSVAVVIDNRRTADAAGQATSVPRTEQEMTQITQLVREAMGFNAERGDTVNVVNAPFSGVEADEGIAPPPFWQDWVSAANLIDIAKTALVALVVLYLWFGLLRPLLRDLMQAGRIEPRISGMEAAMPAPAGPPPVAPGMESDLQAARDIARQDPRVVANVVRDWVGRNE
jgi:flagellar M-ring protein FliF